MHVRWGASSFHIGNLLASLRCCEPSLSVPGLASFSIQSADRCLVVCNGSVAVFCVLSSSLLNLEGPARTVGIYPGYSSLSRYAIASVLQSEDSTSSNLALNGMAHAGLHGSQNKSRAIRAISRLNLLLAMHRTRLSNQAAEIANAEKVI